MGKEFHSNKCKEILKTVYVYSAGIGHTVAVKCLKKGK